MSRLEWDKDTERLYETGTDCGVLYPKNADGTYSTGVPWNGLTSVSSSPEGAEETALWADNIKYLSLRSAEEQKGSIEAYMYPDEFAECNGEKQIAVGVRVGQQKRKAFGFSYRSIIGNDTEGNDYSEKLHVVYNATVSPSEKAYNTVNDSPEVDPMSWEYSTSPSKATIVEDGESKVISTATVEIDCSKMSPEAVEIIKNKLWGQNATTGTNAQQAKDPELPSLQDLLDFLKTTITANPVS